uniref:Uncharacterized protein n=1 Tax=Hucho hucho TaxID=62062 RepID=A0A4W5KEY0_9TELE
MPKGSVCNVLLTSCEDGVCRLWSETVLPEDSILGGQITENTYSSSLPGLGGKDKIQHALEVETTQYTHTHTHTGTPNTHTRTPNTPANTHTHRHAKHTRKHKHTHTQASQTHPQSHTHTQARQTHPQTHTHTKCVLETNFVVVILNVHFIS